MTPARVAQRPPPPPDPPRRPFQSALERAARVRGEAAPAAKRTVQLLPLEVALAPAVEPSRPCPGPPAVAAPEVAAADAPQRVASAVDSIALRDRGSLELRFEHGLTVRVDAAGPGVALAVERGAVAAPVDAAQLAGAVRARGVPVVRAEVRGGGARQQGRRPGPR
jgi:hypothetical protein